MVNPRVKPNVITSGDRALGLGDAFILAPALIELSKNYNVRHLCTNNSYNILKFIDNKKDIKIFNMDQQGHAFTNDHIKSFDLIYWEVENSLRNFGCHAINVVMKLAGLPKYNKVLPEIPIPKNVDDAVKKLFSEFKRPIIFNQPLMSYWNKMITKEKQFGIIDALIKKDYTVIQCTGPGLPPDMIHKSALNFVGKTNIVQSMAMIKNSDLFIGCDSFGQHCAAFMGTPSVVMFCGTTPEDFGYPFNSNIFHPEIAFCQYKCGRPMRLLAPSYSNIC